MQDLEQQIIDYLGVCVWGGGGGGTGKILRDHKDFVLYAIGMLWVMSFITSLNVISLKKLEKHF